MRSSARSFINGGARARGLLSAMLAALCVLGGGLVFASVPAQAELTHKYLSSFTGSLTPSGSFEVGAVAANQSTGDVYVADVEHRVVDIFGSSGEYLSQLKQADGVTPYAFTTGKGTEGLHEIAVDQSTGTIYVVENREDEQDSRSTETRIDIFNALGVYQDEITQGTFKSAKSIAVDDANGNIYLGAIEGSQNIDVFGPTGALLDELPGGSGSIVATDPTTNDLYVAKINGNIEKLNSSGAFVSTLARLQDPVAVSVGASGDVYVADSQAHVVDEFGASGSLVGGLTETSSGPLESPDAVAVGAGGYVYVADANATPGSVYIFGPDITLPDASVETASNVTEVDATLEGTLDPDGVQVSSCAFEYGTTTSYGQTVPCEQTPAQIGAGIEPGPVGAHISGLEPNTVYHYRLLAGNANGTKRSRDSTFTTLGPLAVTEESFTEVGSSSSEVSAEVSVGGRPTTFVVEYGPTTAYGFTTARVNLGDSHESVGAIARLQELQPETTYHFRVVAQNESGTVAGIDTTFTTLPVGGSGLPDGRAYEMVTPPENQNANVYVPFVGGIAGVASSEHGSQTPLPFQASDNGDAVAYVGDPTSGGNGSSGHGKGNQYLATRTAEGWRQVDMQPTGRLKPVYQAFSPDLSVGILDAREESSPLSPEAPGEGYDVLYTRPSDEAGYHAFFTSRPPNRSPEKFHSVGTVDNATASNRGIAYAGASADMRHLLFEANDALTSTPTAIDGGVEKNNLYDSIEGRLVLVNVLPDGTAKAGATFGAPSLSYTDSAGPSEALLANPPDFSNVISQDGSRIFWTSLNAKDEPVALYVRKNDAQPQSPISEGNCEVPTDACTDLIAEGGARFWTATPDGRYAFYTQGKSLYRYDVESDESTALTSDPTKEGVQGVIGVNNSGSDIYFVATDVLATNENGNGERAAAGEDNLYHLHQLGAETTVTFVARLSPEDDLLHELFNMNVDELVGDWQPGLGFRTAEVSPEGDSVVFMSDRSLTGYNNTAFEPGTGGVPPRYMPREEIFIYDGDSDRLSCVSCDPSGEAPVGTSGLQISRSNTYQPRWISDDGSRVFFSSSEPLVAQDSNGLEDVYEWERDGSGSCHREAGCIYLLSGGTGGDNSYLLDASASGDDVFIITRTKLLPQDQNENFDVYDVRVGASEPLAPPVCTGTGCQGVPPAPPIFATPSSLTFEGVGNFPPPAATPALTHKSLTRAQKLAKALKTCRKKPKKGRAVCEKQAKRRYAPKSKAKPRKGSK
jgi:hypothetical protein